MTMQATVNMSNPLWEAASEIDDLTDEMLRMIDQAELDPTVDVFYRLRLKVADVQLHAGDIMAMTKDHPGVETDYVIGAGLLPSRQETP
jgi:hypothetical protein